MDKTLRGALFTDQDENAEATLQVEDFGMIVLEIEPQDSFDGTLTFTVKARHFGYDHEVAGYSVDDPETLASSFVSPSSVTSWVSPFIRGFDDFKVAITSQTTGTVSVNYKLTRHGY